jgi:RNA polymerase sigma-70 factor (ECF subfamily)
MDQTMILQAGQLPDTELVSRILGGEKKLFEQVIRRYNQRLYRIGASILSTGPEAEDAMQSAYMKAYEHLAAFERRSSFGTWLTRIMINECLARKKKQSHYSSIPADMPENNTTMTTPDGLLVNKELSGILENAIASLPEKYRLVFILREVEELSGRETGEALGIEEPNVKVRLNRAKTMLKQHLDGYIRGHVYSFHLSRCDKMVSDVFSRLHIE